jgi:myo-inositol 2-dehydrogenase / D-chiro-inositol 1-dehydrogenase
MNALGIAIVGCGNIGHSHAGALASVPEARLVAAVDMDRARAEAFVARFGADVSATELDAVLGRDDVDAVIIATANNLHAPQAIAALEAGKHVLVQKPMALSVPEADAMVAAAERAGRTLMVSFFQLFHPAVRRAKEIVDAGLIGDVFLVKSMMAWYIPDGLAGWRGDRSVAGGGILMDSHSHNVALFNWLLDSPPVESVYAELGALTWDAGIEDTGVMLLRTPTAIGEISGSCRLLEPNPQMGDHFKDRVEIFGTKGTLHVRPTERPSLQVYVRDGEPALVGGGWAAPRLDWVPYEQRGWSAHLNGDEDPWPAEHRHFVACVRAGEPVVSDGAFGRRVMQQLLAAYASSERKQAVQPGSEERP